jgi:hydroxyethylthiazole kinase-like uncharacterized protein yjeF
MIKISRKILKEIYPERKSQAHKYDFGHLLIIGGSKIYSGSPALAGLAAYRSGVDLVTIVAPERAANIAASFTPDLITYPLAGNWLSKEHLSELLDLSKTAVLIGNGLSKKPETLEAVKEYLKKIELPAVIDADAIQAVAQEKEILANRNFIITPHLHEFFVLTGREIIKENLAQRINLVKEMSAQFKTTILLKAEIDIISDGKTTALNETGNPYMTVGGTGDTLAGICGSLLAQGIDPFKAACAAAYINGRAGDLAASKLKQSLIASDLIPAINQIVR